MEKGNHRRPLNRRRKGVHAFAKKERTFRGSPLRKKNRSVLQQYGTFFIIRPWLFNYKVEKGKNKGRPVT